MLNISESLAVCPVLLLLIGLSAACGGSNVDGGKDSRPVRVVAGEVAVERVAEEISLVGTLAANERVDLRSELDGRVEAVHFEEGEPVAAGKVLIEINAQKLSAQVREAEASFELTKANLDRSNSLVKQRTISHQAHDQARAAFAAAEAALELARQQLREAEISAPFQGIVGARKISVGQYVEKGVELVSLIDLDPIKVEFRVPERYLGRLRPAMEIELRVVSFPDEPFHGSVYFIAPQIDSDTRTALVKARIPNESLKLKPGMFASVRAALSVEEYALVIPEAALMLHAAGARVFVIDAAGTVAVRDVEVGEHLPGRVSIRGGLKQGEQIVVEGVQKVRAGVKVSLAPVEE